MTGHADPLWVIIPAAGSGNRFGGETPKQYLPLSGRTVIEWAIGPFLRRPGIAGIAVVLAPGDQRWRELAGFGPP